jgi:hypothetical protein
MSSKVDRRMKRWQEQRWILDTVIRTVGVEWDQARLAYMSAPGGPRRSPSSARRRNHQEGCRHRPRSLAPPAPSGARRRMKDRAGSPRPASNTSSRSYCGYGTLADRDNKPLLDMEEHMNHCFARYIRTQSTDQRVDVKFATRPCRPTCTCRTPAPAGILACSVDGMDGCKEMMVRPTATASRARHCTAIDGQSGRMLHPIPCRATMAMQRGGGRLPASRPEIDARARARGVSMELFWAVRAAALGDRIKALAVCGARTGFNTIFNMASPTSKLRSCS